MISEYKKQIINALERQAKALDAEAEALMGELNYEAEFPAGDAQRLREAIGIIQKETLNSMSLSIQQLGRAFRGCKEAAKIIDVNRIMSNPIFVDNLTFTGADAMFNDGTMLEFKLFNKEASQRRYYPIFKNKDIADSKKPNWCAMDKCKSNKKQRRSL